MRILKFFRTKTQMILLASFLVLLSFTTFEAAPVYNFHHCTDYQTTYYKPNSTFQNTLNTLLSSLISNATLHNGFYSIHIPLQTPNDLKGLFLCRADVTPSLCQNCVTAAANNITKLCNNQTESIIWYDECLLRYSNDTVLNHIVPSTYLESQESVPHSERTQFNDFLPSFLKGVVQEAVYSPQKFAVKEANFTDSMKFYSLAQCTPDLSTFDCNTCLQGAISTINGKRGARSLLPSCNLRYDSYQFYNVSSVSTQPQLSSPSSGKRKVSIVIAVVVPIVVAVVLFIIGCLFLLKREKNKYKYNSFIQGSSSIRREDLSDVDCLQFDFAAVEAATNCFSNKNKIGEGGFGVVYKGILPNGHEIAVKRLSATSLQGVIEFRNEASLVAKLQHRNLVRLLGFCLEGREKMLVYEYIPNKSLDRYLFDPAMQRELDWSRRYKIIVGIARGILYLHEDSQLRIIHRDLKASNVLLDENMNPKISDFGMAKIFQADQTQVNTGRIVGTYGYMSPEYAMRGQFSVKSDVFSFGVLVLEIVSGKKNTDLNQWNNADDLLSYAWKKWSEQTPLELLDPTLRGSCSRNEVIRCIHMGLLCVQENPNDRPSMETIALMLNSYSVTLSLPRQPPSFLRGRTPDRITQGLNSDQSSTCSIPWSVNEVSITEVYPR
uniref:Cysteine-rich receptor-like protein kinase 10 isoform X1 n=1 Tax=Cicer arietinum TaxID=3827 RepID=A0A3Q7XPR9_CICAR|nr:cysteine-rich receptor-like protein kinase 10 isoform X1 [Cicer arietinum]